MSIQPLAYIPGSAWPAAASSGPLGRYLPLVADGVAPVWLRRSLPPGSWVLDPFGTAPRLAVEAARAGYRVLSAVNNPIARFLFELNAHPPTAGELRQALADLAASQRAGERLEPHLRGLYQTQCAVCRQTVEAQAFVWEKGSAAPVARLYTCLACKDSGERPVEPADVERAARFAPGELHRARALERVTPLSDPDRVYAEEALEMYLPRAVYALLTLVNKLEGQPAPRRRLLAALLLAAFDQANVLWPSPAGRLRPRQLSFPTRFLEKNIWLALEEAVESWPVSLAALPSDGRAEAALAPLPLTIWPDLPPESGGVCLFEGRLRDLASLGRQGDERQVAIGAALAVLPRPNQAYWTLSALWAGWLWGPEANASFKTVLRRRRYDWSWHTEALTPALRSLAASLPPEAPVFGLLNEAEPGFVSAALLAAEGAGFALDGIALRLPDALAQIVWRRSGLAAPESPSAPDVESEEAPPAVAPASRKISPESVAFVQQAALEGLRQRGEPTPFLILHTAALQALIQAGRLPPAQPHSPADLLQQTDALLDKAFGPAGPFTRFGPPTKAAASSARPPETGLWWSQALETTPENGDPLDEQRLSLADRVEMETVRSLLRSGPCSAETLDEAICQAFPGLLTPERELALECLHSYAQADPDRPGLWRLRAEDSPAARRAELEQMGALVQRTGQRLGYPVEQAAFSTRPLWVWHTADVVPAGPVLDDKSGGKSRAKGRGKGRSRAASEPTPAGMVFYVTVSAVLSGVLPVRPPLAQGWIVLPGGRARLLAYKLRRDPRLRAAAEQRWRFVKFRHLRRLAEDESLIPATLEPLLSLDPLENSDPQLSLF